MKTHRRARAFTDPVRLRVLRALSQAPQGLSRGQIANAVKVPTTGLGYHLGVLLDSRTIRKQKKGRQSIYLIDRNEYYGILERLYQVIAGPQAISEDELL